MPFALAPGEKTELGTTVAGGVAVPELGLIEGREDVEANSEVKEGLERL